MTSITFQILDAFTQDLQILVETDTTQEGQFVPDDLSDVEDGEVRRRPNKKRTAVTGAQKRKLIIHLFGMTAAGTPVRVDVEGFEPFFYVKLPTHLKEIQYAFETRLAQEIQYSGEFVLKNPGAYSVTFERRKILMGYTAGKEFTFAKISVCGMQAWRSMKSLFLDKENTAVFALYSGRPSLEVFEANLDPMLRFFHLRNLKPCGWVSLNEVDDADEEIVVIYHSHTETEAYPSRTDIAYAGEPGAHYVLVSTRKEIAPATEFRSYRIIDGNVTEEPVTILD